MANYYYATKKTESAPTYIESTTTYDFTTDNNGWMGALGEIAVDGPVTADFPTSFTLIKTPSDAGAWNGEMNRKRKNTPSNGGNILGPQSVDNWYIYTEGSNASNNSTSNGFRFCILLPGNFNRDDGLSFSAKVALTWYDAMNPQVSLYHRPVGGTNLDWVQVSIGPVSLGGSTYVWQDWVASNVLGPGEPVQLMIVFASQTAIATWPDKAFFDNGLDDITITETLLV